MDDVKRPNGTNLAPDATPSTTSDDSGSAATASKPITITDGSESPAPVTEPKPTDETPEIAEAEAAVVAAEEAVKPAVTVAQPEPATTPENTSSNPLDAIKQADPGNSSYSSSETPAQKGAGLDLSSLSEEDAKDLGVPVPAHQEAPTDLNAANMSMAKPPKKGSKAVVIVVALLVALALIAGAGYAYYSTSKKNKKSSNSTPAVTQPTSQSATEVKAADIDSTVTSLDASLKKVDDTKEFTANDLSDATLGIQ